MFDYYKPTIKDVDKAMAALQKIERPYGDNEGDAINSSSVYYSLSYEMQDAVNQNVQTINDYIRDSDGNPNRRSINTMNKRGYSTDLDADQHDPDRLVGRVTVGELIVDLSDLSTEIDDDE